MKKMKAALLFMAITSALLCCGCGESKGPVLLQEGVVLTVQWTDGTGKSRGLSRLDSPLTIPGGTGSFNMDIYGRLFSTHLEIVDRKVKDPGPQIIPIQRLDSLQFGTGGRTFPTAQENK